MSDELENLFTEFDDGLHLSEEFFERVTPPETFEKLGLFGRVKRWWQSLVCEGDVAVLLAGATYLAFVYTGGFSQVRGFDLLGVLGLVAVVQMSLSFLRKPLGEWVKKSWLKATLALVVGPLITLLGLLMMGVFLAVTEEGTPIFGGFEPSNLGVPIQMHWLLSRPLITGAFLSSLLVFGLLFALARFHRDNKPWLLSAAVPKRRFGFFCSLSLPLLVLFAAALIFMPAADRRQSDFYSTSMLVSTIKGGDVDKLDQFLENYPQALEWFFRPLTLAKDPETAQYLIDKGLAVNGHADRTPLSGAVEDDNLELVLFYLEKGADPGIGAPSAYDRASKKSDTKMMEVLLGAENGRWKGKEFTRLYQACLRAGRTEMAEVLLQSGKVKTLAPKKTQESSHAAAQVASVEPGDCVKCLGQKACQFCFPLGSGENYSGQDCGECSGSGDCPFCSGSGVCYSCDGHGFSSPCNTCGKVSEEAG